MLQKKIPTNKWLILDNQSSIRQISKTVKFPLTKKHKLIMHKLIDFVRFSQNPLKNINQKIKPAVGLAAPQIGVNIKMYYIRININNLKHNNQQIIEHALINPNIIYIDNQLVCLKEGEGCLSVIKQHKGYVPRYFKIQVEGYDYLKKKYICLKVKSYEAIVFQHEQTHLEGQLYYDFINQNNPWKKENNWIII